MQPEILSARDHLVVLWRLKSTTVRRRLDVPVVDVIKLRDRQIVSLEMFHHDAMAVCEFLDSAAQ
jgi:hypothetical protein